MYLTICFVIKRNLSICYILQRHFQQAPIDLEFHFKNYTHFLKYFGLYIMTTVNTKTLYQEFLFICLFKKLQWQKFSFLEAVESSRNTSYLRTNYFYKKCQYCFLALVFLYTSEKILWKNYVMFRKWNLKGTAQSA